MASLNPLQGALGLRRAAHLLRRTSYRYTRSKVDEMATQTAGDALTSLLTGYPLQLDQPLFANGNSTPAPWINPPQPFNAPLPAQDFILRRYLLAWWVNEALHDPGITHKMNFFLHQFMAVDGDSGSSMDFFDYLGLLRWGALGNFKKLATKMVVNNCMLSYLNNDENYVNNPNENFAREFFELFTIGRGQPAGPGDYTNYTEDDIVQAARVLTGYNHMQRDQYQDPETGIPSGKPFPQSHDFLTKTFSIRFGGTVIKPPTQDAAGMLAELDAFVNMIFTQEETARNLCRRLYHFFVRRNIVPEVETDIIGPLAQTLISQNFEIKPVLAQLLQSEHFFDMDDANPNDETIGSLIKSPLELVLQALSFLNVPIPDPVTDNDKHYNTFYNATVLERMLGQAGMNVFYPSDVAGYPGYYQDPDLNRQFFNSATIVARYKLPQMLLTGTYAWGGSANEPIGTILDVSAWVRDSGVFGDPSDAGMLVQDMVRYLFPETPDADRLNYFLNTVFLDGLPAADWNYAWQHYLTTSDNADVKIPLGRLLNGVMYAPEYQVF
jgi:uncharacterized protein (DUF1800 family)